MSSFDFEGILHDLDQHRGLIEDDLCIVFSDANWRHVENLVIAYLAGRLTWLYAPLSAEERNALLNISKAAIDLTKALRSAPPKLCERLQIGYDPDNKLNALVRLTNPRRMPSSDDILDWASASLALLNSVPSRKKGQKRATEETNHLLGMLKFYFETSVTQIEGRKSPHFNKFAHRIFQLLPAKFAHRPQSFEAALKSFHRSPWTRMTG